MELLASHIRSLFKEAIKNADEVTRRFDEKTIHKMRIAFKKIQALFSLLLFISNGNLKVEKIEKLKNGFRKAGRIRELQLVVTNLKSTQSLNDTGGKMIIQLTKKREKKAEKKFRDYFRSKGKKEMKELKEVMLKASERAVDVDLTSYFNDLSSKIISAMSKADRSNGELHRLRKLLKEFSYNLFLLDEEQRNHYEQILPSHTLEKLEKQIGEWHDEIIFQFRIIKTERELAAHTSDTHELNDLKTFSTDVQSHSQKMIQTDLRKIARLVKK